MSGPGGTVILDPKVMGVLLELAASAGRVLSRDELLSRLWPDTVVTEDALTRCVYELRRQLAQAGGNERYKTMFQTLPKRGYRLDAEVTAASPADEPRGTGRKCTRWLVAAAAVIAAAATALPWLGPKDRDASAVRSIAVLPFVDMSAAKDQRFFSDGITEEILNQLSQSANLRVIARTSSFSFRDTSLDVPQIAARLGVQYLLEGSVRKAGNRIRVTAQLIDAATNSHLWSQTYDRGLGDLFAIQDEVAGSVAAALNAALGEHGAQARAPTDIDAYQNYLQGQFLYNRRLEGDVERSVGYFEDAIRQDPKFARAWAALAGACRLLAYGIEGFDAEWSARQGAAARRAVELDPDLAVAHVRLAQYLWLNRRPAEAIRHFERALALDPDDPLVLAMAATQSRAVGDRARALHLWGRIVAQDPLSSVYRQNYAVYLLEAGHLEESRAQYDKLVELNPAAGPEPTAGLVRVLTLMKRYDDAAKQIVHLPEGEYRDFGLALQYDAPGRRAEADAALTRLRDEPVDYHGFVRLAEAYAFRGMNDDAFAVLQRHRTVLDSGQASDAHNLQYFLEEVATSRLLQPLHGDPRWSALILRPG
ncbi:MAG: tetratricopeptide repeat protein [Steroidobacteraceae bacterium]